MLSLLDISNLLYHLFLFNYYMFILSFPVLQELGGNSWWVDRFLAQHIATFYYFMTVFMYILSPRMACKYLILLFDCIQGHVSVAWHNLHV